MNEYYAAVIKNKISTHIDMERCLQHTYRVDAFFIVTLLNIVSQGASLKSGIWEDITNTC